MDERCPYCWRRPSRMGTRADRYWACLPCGVTIEREEMDLDGREQRESELRRLRAVGLPGAADWLERARGERP